MNTFTLSCESTADLPLAYLNERSIPVIPYTYIVNGHAYEDNMGQNPDLMPKFYRMLDKGLLPSTSQINETSYYNFFEPLVKKGDLLHLAFSSGLSGSVNNAYLAAAALKKKYPERTILVLDTLSGAGGYGLLVDYAADLRDQGASLSDIALWVNKHRACVHHQFVTTNLEWFRRSGRIHGIASHLASVLTLYPLIRLDENGMANAYGKVRGGLRAVRTLTEEMEFYAKNGTDYDGKCFISHADCPELAHQLKSSIQHQFPHVTKPVRILPAGTVTAVHCGPGAVGIFFLGIPRPY